MSYLSAAFDSFEGLRSALTAHRWPSEVGVKLAPPTHNLPSIFMCQAQYFPQDGMDPHAPTDSGCSELTPAVPSTETTEINTSSAIDSARDSGSRMRRPRYCFLAKEFQREQVETGVDCEPQPAGGVELGHMHAALSIHETIGQKLPSHPSHCDTTQDEDDDDLDGEYEEHFEFEFRFYAGEGYSEVSTDEEDYEDYYESQESHDVVWQRKFERQAGKQFLVRWAQYPEHVKEDSVQGDDGYDSDDYWVDRVDGKCEDKPQ